mgnify:CR=1 FL=1
MSQQRGKSNSKGCCKSCAKEVKCHLCYKKGHFKCECYNWKKEKGKGKNIDHIKQEMKESTYDE